MDKELKVSGSFNGLLERLSAIDYDSISLVGRRKIKRAKKERINATIRRSEFEAMTGLTEGDIDLFVSLWLLLPVDGDEDPLPFKDVFCLLRIFERSVDEGLISASR